MKKKHQYQYQKFTYTHSLNILLVENKGPVDEAALYIDVSELTKDQLYTLASIAIRQRLSDEAFVNKGEVTLGTMKELVKKLFGLDALLSYNPNKQTGL